MSVEQDVSVVRYDVPLIAGLPPNRSESNVNSPRNLRGQLRPNLLSEEFTLE